MTPKRRHLIFIKSKVDINNTITQWDEQTDWDLILIVEIKFKVDDRRSLSHHWKVQA
ncbi:MAG TPA: hypothetical protein VF884_01925 [Nitrososphaeraceae archaeon]